MALKMVQVNQSINKCVHFFHSLFKLITKIKQKLRINL